MNKKQRKNLIIFITPNIITFLSFVFSYIFYYPTILLHRIYFRIGILLIKSSIEKYNRPSGYKGKLGLKLINSAYKMGEEVVYDILSYTTQIREKEIIMKAIRADKAYPYVPKSDRKLAPKERTTFMVKFIDPYKNAQLQDQIFDVKGAGSARRERILSGTQQLEVLKECLNDWDNFEDPDSTKETPKFVKFDRKNIDDMIAMIPPNVRSEIVDFARGESEVDEGEG